MVNVAFYMLLSRFYVFIVHTALLLSLVTFASTFYLYIIFLSFVPTDLLSRRARRLGYGSGACTEPRRPDDALESNASDDALESNAPDNALEKDHAVSV